MLDLNLIEIYCKVNYFALPCFTIVREGVRHLIDSFDFSHI